MNSSELTRGVGIVGGLLIKDSAGYDGLQPLKVARFTFDPTTLTALRATGAYNSLFLLPNKAVVVGGFMQVNAALTSGGSLATVAVSVQAANDISTATAVSGAPWSTTGLKAITPKANTPESTGIALTAVRNITVTVGVEALTGGKLTITLYYTMGA